MKVRRRWVMCVLMAVVMGGTGVAWLRHTPEPNYEGVRFSVLLDGGIRDHEKWKLAREGTKELGAAVVPYLASQFDNDPLRELAFKVRPKMPNKIATMLPDPKVYRKRRNSAAGLITFAGTNAVRALPGLLALMEAEAPNYTHNFVRAIGMLAPGTKYEERARKLLLNVTTEMRHERDLTTRRMAYHLLGSFPSPEVTTALLEGMNEHGVKNACIQSLVKLGTNAVPELKKLAEKEEGHVRPATLVLEKIEKQLAANKSNEPISGEWPF
jgi:hypothetical protein